MGMEVAATLAEAFLEDTLDGLKGMAASLVLAFDEAEVPLRWRQDFFQVWQQGAGGLGERLERILARALEEHSWAIALGADSPGLPSAFLEQAVAALTVDDGPRAVLGPCRDGGFYLLGVRSITQGLLAGVRWSTPFALEDVERALRLSAITPKRLPSWFDVDEVEDLASLRSLIEQGSVQASATARILSSLR
jgi:glycosyltransferase A (GT-A) superfamily protein (DUF2064 family)